MSPKADAYEVVTRRIIEALEQGVVPWHRPWKNVAGVGPTSLASGKEYRGINVWILAVEQVLKGYSSPYWLTFKQAKERGGSVRKGEKGTQIVLWKPVRKSAENEAGETENRSYLLLRYFTVFNVDQCDDIEAPVLEAIPERDPIETCEAIVASYVGRPEVKHGGNRAFYSPALDYIQMPLTGQFDSAEGYYATLFHELAHSTGHESRLGRKSLIQPAPFGSEDYSREELVAELAAAFVCGEAGIPVNVEQSAAYLKSWLRVLKDDRKMLVQAAAQAQKAADLMQGIEVKKGESAPADSTVNHKEERWQESPSRSRTSTRTGMSRPARCSSHPRATISMRGGTRSSGPRPVTVTVPTRISAPATPRRSSPRTTRRSSGRASSGSASADPWST